MENDTIAAISTPPGKSGIGIVRISGPLSIHIADRLFFNKSLARPSQFKSHTLYYGYIKAGKKADIIDEALIAVMRKPSTYTREDIVEINCHGGIVCLRQTLELALSHGARLAEPGEFTKRAFLSGRIDLMQAEAVCDVITSRTREALNIAQRQLTGRASEKIRDMRASLIETAAGLEADINFPEEELETSQLLNIRTSLSGIAKGLASIIDSARRGIILREGITAVICGKPNVGKSSLMNGFLRQDRVIVAPHPGTTRDTIEETVELKGMPLKLVDTAGIADAQDDIARESVERSRRYLDAAELILLVLDSSGPLTKDDFDIIDAVKNKKVLAVLNKSDLPEVSGIDDIGVYLGKKTVIRVSAKNNQGLEDLENAIYDIFFSGEIPAESMVLSNSRQSESAKKALAFIESAIRGIDEQRYRELLMLDIKDAANALGSITGEAFTEEVLESIFSRFCIGK